MKLKYYLRGLGTGIFVTALILSIAFDVRLSKLKSLNENGTESKSESISETTSTESTSYSEIVSGTESEDQSTNTDELTENITEETTLEGETSIPEQDISTAIPQSPTVTLDIYSGMSSNKVAARLEELGVVEDAEDFNNYMYSRHIENSIRIGRFDISQDATYDEIINVITGRQ